MRFGHFPRRREFGWEEDSFCCKMGERIAMPNSRPMPTVGAGVSELRVKSEDVSYWVF
jgi:hypothetical protein